MATPLSSRFAPASTTTLHVPLHHRGRRAPKFLAPPLRASSSGEDTASADQEQPAAATKTATADDDFEERVMRIKSRVGPKKRGARKKKGSGAGASSSNAVTLPPVPLREAKSRFGAPVEFGFTAYSERLNGALAAVGLTALLLVELGSGQALVKYHQPATLFLQVYTVAAAAALFVKYEKERISKWPGAAAAKPPADR